MKEFEGEVAGGSLYYLGIGHAHATEDNEYRVYCYLWEHSSGLYWRFNLDLDLVKVSPWTRQRYAKMEVSLMGPAMIEAKLQEKDDENR